MGWGLRRVIPGIIVIQLCRHGGPAATPRRSMDRKFGVVAMAKIYSDYSDNVIDGPPRSQQRGLLERRTPACASGPKTTARPSMNDRPATASRPCRTREITGRGKLRG